MSLKQIKFKDDDISFINPSWEELDKLIFLLANKILSKKIKIDRLVALAKGGWTFSRYLVDLLSIDKIASLGIKFYSGVGERLKKPFIYQNIPVSIYKEKVLLFDDVADTGASLEFAKRYLEDNGADKIYTATIFYKPTSKIKPNFYAFETSSWIIFPYEKRETVKNLSKRWSEKGLNNKEIEKRLKRLGIPKEYYLNFAVNSN